ncbi:hypothetical protein [Metabacillus hrfriensis]|uniref:Uncharacterized protein n=1 Tax=Metabacillus hrfriensis TaxID=3048891 RepID=A0ACD4R9F7_9BACI|nr:hypothetical protein [Metabacillus sp. CT-WN-B3]WHZ57076.1 hypothetical protein QLQ22_20815 [Metabacillus sp. CT-WN-B3]
MKNAWSNLAVNILIRIFMQNGCSAIFAERVHSNNEYKEENGI